MKKIFTIIAAATLFAACSSNSDLDAKKDIVLTDTTAMYKSNASTDISEKPQQQEVTPPPVKIIRETRVVYVDRTRRAPKQVVKKQDPVINTVPQPQTETKTGTATTDKAGASTTANTGTESIPTAQKEQKKGWNNATKDAVIGGVGGAVVGAVLSKKKGQGAIIGGILGAAGGYILGNKKDKKDLADNFN